MPDPVAQVNEPRRLDAFLVSYSDARPGRAQRVANRLVNVFVDENSKAARRNAEDTAASSSRQLQAQPGAARRRSRRSCAPSKESHMGQLPEQTQANLPTLSGLRQQLESNATALRGEQDRLSMIERQIEGDAPGQRRRGLRAWRERQRSGADAREPRRACSARARRGARDLHGQASGGAARSRTNSRPRGRTRGRTGQAGVRPHGAAHARSHLPAADRRPRDVAPAHPRSAAVGERPRRQIGSLPGARRVGAAGRAAARRRCSATTTSSGSSTRELSSKLHAATIAENVERNRSGEQFTVLYPATLPDRADQAGAAGA